MNEAEHLLEETKAAQQLADMAQMIARLACELKKVSPCHPMPVVASEFLHRNKLAGHHAAAPDELVDAGAGYADEPTYSGPERRAHPTERQEDAYTLGLKQYTPEDIARIVASSPLG